MLPEKELLLSLRIAKLESFPIQGGISPVSLLFDKEIQFNWVQLLNPEGMVPLSSLKSRIKFCRVLMYLSSSGISPWSWFNHMIKSRRLESDPKLEGMVPVR